MSENIQFSQVALVVLAALSAFALSTALHEAAHLLLCKLLKCRVIGMKVLFLHYDGKDWSLRLKGKNHCAFATENKCKMRRIVVAGPLTELFFAIMCLLVGLWIQVTWLKLGLICGAVLILISVAYGLLPMTNGDGKILFEREKE